MKAFKDYIRIIFYHSVWNEKETEEQAKTIHEDQSIENGRIYQNGTLLFEGEYKKYAPETLEFQLILHPTEPIVIIEDYSKNLTFIHFT